MALKIIAEKQGFRSVKLGFSYAVQSVPIEEATYLDQDKVSKIVQVENAFRECAKSVIADGVSVPENVIQAAVIQAKPLFNLA